MDEKEIFEYFQRQLLVSTITKDFQYYISELTIEKPSDITEKFLTEILVRIGFTGISAEVDNVFFDKLKAFNPLVHRKKNPYITFKNSKSKVGANLLENRLELLIPDGVSYQLIPVIAYSAILALLRGNDIKIDTGKILLPARESRVNDNKKIMVVGAGGIGGPVIQTLLRNNLGRLVVIEPDVVSYTNLHRQPFYTEKDIGKAKVSVLEDSLKSYKLNELKLYKGKFSAHIAEKEKPDLVIVAVDNYKTRYQVNEILYKIGIPFVDAGVGAISGYVMLHTAESSCYRCFVGDGRSDTTSPKPIVASTSYFAGIMAAAFACEYLNHNTGLLNKVYWFDFDNQLFTNFEVPKKSNCPICGGK